MMKKLLTPILGLALLAGAIPSFAQDTPPKTGKKAGKKGGKKKSPKKGDTTGK
jgi:hypothetical protein